jgi:hypothetical protein
MSRAPPPVIFPIANRTAARSSPMEIPNFDVTYGGISILERTELARRKGFSVLSTPPSKYSAFHSAPHTAVAVEIHAFSKWN